MTLRSSLKRQVSVNVSTKNERISLAEDQEDDQNEAGEEDGTGESVAKGEGEGKGEKGTGGAG